MWHYSAAAESNQRYHALNTCGHFSSSAKPDSSFRDWSRQAFPASHCPIAMATIGDPEPQKYDATQNLLVIERQNNAIQNPNIDAAQTAANKEELVGGVMDAASRIEEQESTKKERRNKLRQWNDIMTSVIVSIIIPVYFGLFGILTIQYTAASNDQSQVANQIALLALCYHNSVGHHGGPAKDKLLIRNSLVTSV
jgi:hypothetical protein